MKKAFTLIELLVVIAIIAILAAILFPVFAQAKAAAKNISSVSSTKQMGTATIMYTNDYDDTFPLVSICRPNGGAIGTGLAYPYPANDGEIVSGGNTIWETAPRISMANSFVSNSVQPYTKSYPLEALPSSVNYSDTSGGEARTWPPASAGFATPQYSGLTFNGDLHRYNATAVVSPSVAVMWWAGEGASNIYGVTVAQPYQNCAGTVDDCQFSSGSAPAPQVQYSSQPGDVMFLSLNPGTNWNAFSNKKGPFVHTDTSCKAMPMGSATAPAYINAAGAFTDPFAQLYSINLGGVTYNVFNYWTCDDGSTVIAGHLTASFLLSEPS